MHWDDNTLIDTKTGEVLARVVRYEAGWSIDEWHGYWKDLEPLYQTQFHAKAAAERMKR
jgi:hypothetical protein